MADPAAPHTAKVSAATAMLRFGRESIEMDDLCERVEALEAGRRVTDRVEPPDPRRRGLCGRAAEVLIGYPETRAGA